MDGSDDGGGGLIDLSVRRIGKTPLCLLPFKKLKWVLLQLKIDGIGQYPTFMYAKKGSS
jgi:hypothetical protein